MRVIPDKLALLLCGCVLLLMQPLSVVSVAALLIGVTVSALSSVFSRPDFACAGGIGVAVLCFWQPEFVCFLPLVFYDVILYCPLPFFGAALPPILAVEGAFGNAAARTSMLLLFLGIAFLLCKRSASLEHLREELLRQRDSGHEVELLLESKNRDLMEKQDYEIRLATLGERNRIAREIHDNVGHMLSRSILQVGALMATNRDESMASGLSGLRNTLSEAMDSIRSSVHDLHDESIDLSTQIESLIREFRFCPVRLDYSVEGAMDRGIKYAFLSIIREALSNIARHSEATQATITIREHPALFQLIIQDNGRGASDRQGQGIGLRNMADRVAAFNGHLHMDGRTGFKIFISVPKGDKTA